MPPPRCSNRASCGRRGCSRCGRRWPRLSSSAFERFFLGVAHGRGRRGFAEVSVPPQQIQNGLYLQASRLLGAASDASGLRGGADSDAAVSDRVGLRKAAGTLLSGSTPRPGREPPCCGGPPRPRPGRSRHGRERRASAIPYCLALRQCPHAGQGAPQPRHRGDAHLPELRRRARGRLPGTHGARQERMDKSPRVARKTVWRRLRSAPRPGRSRPSLGAVIYGTAHAPPIPRGPPPREETRPCHVGLVPPSGAENHRGRSSGLWPLPAGSSAWRVVGVFAGRMGKWSQHSY